MSPSTQTSVCAVLSLSWLKLGPTRWSRKSSSFPPVAKWLQCFQPHTPLPSARRKRVGLRAPPPRQTPSWCTAPIWCLQRQGHEPQGRQPLPNHMAESEEGVLPGQIEDAVARQRVNELWALLGGEASICEGRDALPGHPHKRRVEQASRTWRTDDTCWWEAHPAGRSPVSEALASTSQAVRRWEPP